MNHEFKKIWTANCWMICWVAQLFGSLNIILFGSVNSTRTICDMLGHRKKKRSRKIVWKCVSTLKSFSILCCSLIVQSILFRLFFIYFRLLTHLVNQFARLMKTIAERWNRSCREIISFNFVQLYFHNGTIVFFRSVSHANVSWNITQISSFPAICGNLHWCYLRFSSWIFLR